VADLVHLCFLLDANELQLAA